MPTDARRQHRTVRPARLRDQPRWLAAYMVGVGVGAGVAAVLALSGLDGSLRGWATACWLAVIAVGFEEASHRMVRLKIRLSSALRADMTSVWGIAAAVALSPGRAVLLMSAILVYDWFRHQRPAGEPLYRKSFSAATIVLAVLAASVAFHEVQHDAASLPWMAGGLVAIIAGIAVETAVNRVLVTVVLAASGAPARELVGTRDDNLIELATLCLGGLVALATLYQPWLAILAVAPMFTMQRGALLREMETAATTDAKTGLLNAIAWEHLADRELARARRERYALSVLIIDIDRFKRVNDQYGHLVGDQVLRRIGKTISAEVREYDGVGRFGGEEFVVLLPEVDAVESMVIAERIRSRINRLRVSDLIDGVAADADDRLSVSIGVTSSVFGAEDVADLLREADTALYRAKAEGRNRVLLAGTGGSGAASVFNTVR